MTYDAASKEGLLKTLSPYVNEFYGFDINDWNENNTRSNIVVTDNNEDFALFEKETDTVYMSHIFCRNKKGKEAFDFGKWAVSKMFSEYGVEVLKGLTPLSNRPALIAARKIGFKAYGTTDTVVGPCQIFILTKGQWNNE